MTVNNVNERTKFTESLPKFAESSLNHQPNFIIRLYLILKICNVIK